MSGLDEAEVAAIAEHEHIDDIAAAALAQCLLVQPRGAVQLRTMIMDNLREALRRHDLNHAKELVATLTHFISEHKAELIASVEDDR
jgi:hypothetical protein